MEIITNYEEHWDKAVDFMWEALPNLAMAVIIYFLGSWAIKLINRLVRKFFAKADQKVALKMHITGRVSFCGIGGDWYRTEAC